jgi:hypothetical protein
VRTRSRPERHFADSFATIRLAIARALLLWLPRCPICQQRLPAPPDVPDVPDILRLLDRDPAQ